MAKIFENQSEAEKEKILRQIARSYHQPDLFPPQGKTGRAYREGDKWIATIEDGFWVGHGKTKDEAIKKVLNVYEEELSRLQSRI